jgi:putative ABC transport system permease protein
VNAWQSVRIAVRALRVNKLRSALNHARHHHRRGGGHRHGGRRRGSPARVAEQIQSLGSNLIIVLSGSSNASGVRLGTGSQLSITEDDATAIAREVASVQAAAPSVRGGARWFTGA